VKNLSKPFLATATLCLLCGIQSTSTFAQWTIRGDAGPSPTAPSSGANDPGTPHPEFAKLDLAMRNFMNETHAPNAQLAVAYGGKIIYSRAYTNTFDVASNPAGRARQTGINTLPAGAITYDEPTSFMTTLPDTRFRVASLSKLVTGLAMQQLILDGLVTMDDSAYEILRADSPAIFGPATQSTGLPPSDSRMRSIKIRHLLNHEAGVDRDNLIFPSPANGHPAGQPADIVAYDDPPGAVTPLPYPYNNDPTTTTFVRTCKDQMQRDLPRRILHYAPGSPPQIAGRYQHFYSNWAYCFAQRVIEIKSGMSIENYVLSKVLNPAGVSYPRLALPDVRDRLYASDPRYAEINEYYDQPLSVDPNARLYSIFCATYARAPFSPCAVPRPRSLVISEYGGAGGWVFSAQEYLRMLLSASGRTRAPHLLDFPANNVSGSDSIYGGPSLYAATATQAGRYSIGAYATEFFGAPMGINLEHSGSLPGTRTYYVINRRGYSFVVFTNTNADWGLASSQRGCTQTTARRVKAWCWMQGLSTLPEPDQTPPVAPSTLSPPPPNTSVALQLIAMSNSNTTLPIMQAAPDLWVDQIPLPCALDVDGDGQRNPLRDGNMMLRAMLGMRGTAITASAAATASQSLDRTDRTARDLVTTKVLDIDGDGQVNANRDGLILIRALLGFKGSAVTAGIDQTNATRTTWDTGSPSQRIKTYLNSRCNATL
jgi:CubicO group peptidase (beta-lactamase class C family)